MDNAEQNGLFFELDGTTFNVVARKGGTDTAVASASFSVDTGFTPGNTNNTYRIEYSAGRALFYAAQSGEKRLLHVMTDSTDLLTNTTDLSQYYENTNDGNTTDVEMVIRGSSVTVRGCEFRFNEIGSLLTGSMDNEIALGRAQEWDLTTKYGRNPDVDTASTPEDMWNGGSEYSGFDATDNEDIEVFSSDVDDQGQVVSSGNATGGSRTTLIDSGATFVTDSVAVGDMVVNDTQTTQGS